MKNKIISVILVFLISSMSLPVFAYKDINENAWYYYAVTKLQQLGIMSGYNGNFNPSDYVTRAELAQTITNTIEYVVDEKTEEFINIVSKLDMNVVIYSPDLSKSGSGVYIDNDLILTAYHVVDDQNSSLFMVETNNVSESFFGELVYYDEKNDLALLKSPMNSEHEYVRIANNLLLLEDVYIIGNPISFKNLISTGVIGNLSVDYGGASYTEVYTSLNFGNSGGMVLNKDGELVGIALAKISDEYGSGIGFIAKLDTIRKFINKYKETQR